MQDNFTVTETTNAHGVKIAVIGVGGAGQNMLNELIQSDIANEVKLVAANADAQALEQSNAPYKIQLGPKTTRGLGCGMKPEIGKAAALESEEEIRQVLME